MARGLLKELKQSKPFAHPEEELFLSLVRTADLLGRHPSLLFKERGISPAQYNVLRILRGAGPKGLPCGEIAVRMVTRDPDITRLLDRLQRRRLVIRARAVGDRRVVSTRITAVGLALLKPLDQLLVDIHVNQLGFLPAKEIKSLLGRLEKIRGHLGTPAEQATR
jgi:DNA-binding MarR family transcriptional regulator